MNTSGGVVVADLVVGGGFVSRYSSTDVLSTAQELTTVDASRSPSSDQKSCHSRAGSRQLDRMATQACRQPWPHSRWLTSLSRNRHFLSGAEGNRTPDILLAKRNRGGSGGVGPVCRPRDIWCSLVAGVAGRRLLWLPKWLPDYSSESNTRASS